MLLPASELAITCRRIETARLPSATGVIRKSYWGDKLSQLYLMRWVA